MPKGNVFFKNNSPLTFIDPFYIRPLCEIHPGRGIQSLRSRGCPLYHSGNLASLSPLPLFRTKFENPLDIDAVRLSGRSSRIHGKNANPSHGGLCGRSCVCVWVGSGPAWKVGACLRHERVLYVDFRGTL
jgi:hypothetical protein